MSELFGALGGLVNKVATKTEDGLQRFANKTEDVAKRVNRTVNPLSSHFRENSGDSPHQLAGEQHAASSNPLAYAQSPYAGRYDGATPGGAARRDSAAVQGRQHSQHSIKVEPPEMFLQEGLSSKSALFMADQILEVVTRETAKLEADRDDYKQVLLQIQQMRREQEEAYAKAAMLMEKREQELRAHILKLENEKDGVTVSF